MLFDGTSSTVKKKVSLDGPNRAAKPKPAYLPL
jgi:hypothetical protein